MSEGAILWATAREAIPVSLRGIAGRQLAFLGVIWILTSMPLFAQFGVANPDAACSPKHQKDKAMAGQFLFKSYLSDDDGACLEVLRDDKVIFRRTLDSPQGFTLGQVADSQYGILGIANGTDITGRGHPDMIVSFYTGGAHCCLFDYVFELEPNFKLLAKLDAEDSWPAYFADLDHNQHYYYLAQDWTFAYWWISFAGSPFHSVVLRYVDDPKGGGFHLAIDRMQGPAPTPEEWQKALREVRHELRLEQENMFNELPDVLWQEILDLIYTGHSDLAWKFLDEVGPKAQQGNYPDLADFCSQLKTSPYWPDLAPTLKNTPPSCANVRPARK
jgi:hypothetical protein